MATKEIITTTVPTAIPIEDLTQVIIDGTGVFDKFLTLHRMHLTREFEDARIQGKEYSEVYTKTYIAHLEQAIQFLLAKEKQAYELNLLEAQTEKVKAEAAIDKYNLEYTLPKDNQVKDAQIDKINADIALTNKQKELADYELKNKLPAEVAQINKQIEKLDIETKKELYELNNILPKQVDLIAAQIDKMRADADTAKKQLEILQWELTNKLPMELALVTAQVDKMKADTELAKEQLKLAEKELAMKDKELILKDKEVAIAEKQLQLAQQKVITETAQTDSSVVKPGSVIDMNNKALQSQIDGVKRDSEQKVLQLIIQTWITRMNNDAAYINDANMLTDKYIGRAVAKVFEGVNISLSLIHI